MPIRGYITSYTAYKCTRALYNLRPKPMRQADTGYNTGWLSQQPTLGLLELDAITILKKLPSQTRRTE